MVYKRRKHTPIKPENADALFARDSAQIIGYLKAYVTRCYGARCPDYDKDCCVCRAWEAVDIIEDLGQ